MRHVIFLLEKERYALPLSSVREVVIPPPTFTRVPRAAPAVRGVINLRGRVVVVVDLRRLLELKELTACAKIILLDRGRRDLGLLVTEVEGIETIERIGPSHGKKLAGLKGIARLRGQAVTVLEADGVDATVLGAFAR